MSKTSITCTTCPIGCDIVVDGDGKAITSMQGAACKRGEKYAAAEYTHPERILTSLVKVEGTSAPLVPVRSRKPVPKNMLPQCMEKIKSVVLRSPVTAGDIVVADICGLGVDMVATGSVRE